MLQNVVDMTDVLYKMVQEGYEVVTEVVATFCPYLRGHIKRFEEYAIDLETIPPPLQPDKLFFIVSGRLTGGVNFRTYYVFAPLSAIATCAQPASLREGSVPDLEEPPIRTPLLKTKTTLPQDGSL
jgi:hypothetical protein